MSQSTDARVRSRTAELEDRRLAKALDGLTHALQEEPNEIPARVVEIIPRRGMTPNLSVEAIELARQTYFERHGTLADAARAIIAADLVDDTGSYAVVYDRLKNWWRRESWPRRSTKNNFRIRDANHEGGLFRGTRLCGGVATGNGLAIAGEPCGETALADSDFCPWHDPRPEYESLRKKRVDRMLEGRRKTLVPVGPLREVLDHHRKRLLAEEQQQENGAHHNSNGVGALARTTGLDASVLVKLLGGQRGTRKPLTVVTVKTAQKCLDPLGEDFETVYGFPPPPGKEANLTCPSCGSEKTAAARTCRDCFEKSTYKNRCRHVTSSGHRCPVTTDSPSGYCSKCRKQILHVRVKGHQGRFAHPELVMYALDAHRSNPAAISIARRLWLTDAAGARNIYASREALRGELVKLFGKHRWRDGSYAASKSLECLLANHGPIEWPDPDEKYLTDGELPSGPFIGWLRVQVAKTGSFKETGELTGLNPDHISRLIRGKGPDWIRVKTIKAAMNRTETDLPLTHLFDLEDLR